MCCVGYSQLVVAEQPDQNANQGGRAEEGKRVALVIGNEDYKHPSYTNKGCSALCPLTTPSNDAQDMTDALTQLGFSVVALVQNADKSTMDKAIDDFINNLDEHTEALFYFSGHGGQNGRSQSLLYPVDMVEIDYSSTLEEEAKKKEEISAISVNNLLSRMKEKKSPTNIIILDACRSPEIPSQEDSEGIKNISGKIYGLGAADGLDETGQQRISDGILIAYATAPGGSSIGRNPQCEEKNEKKNEEKKDEQKCHSVYTGFLLENIFYPGPAYFVFEKIRQQLVGYHKKYPPDLPKNTNNRDRSPQYQLPWESNSLRKTFYFVPRKLHVHGGFQ
jgi:uncharacterized protein YcfJ